jgi:hypothetical protein
LKNPKPEHKFFDRLLDNDLEDLYSYLYSKAEDILAGKVGNIPEDVLSNFNIYNGPATQLGEYYNIFTWDHPAIINLKQSLRDIIIEASYYYGIDFEQEDYHINGWFNLDFESPEDRNDGVSPLKHSEHYHDHAGGTGAPIFHGYYCVNAEPSSTFYKINRERDFENINKNNRAIVSETGHPHGRDDWYEEKPRITIAYDIGKKEFIRNSIKL